MDNLSGDFLRESNGFVGIRLTVWNLFQRGGNGFRESAKRECAVKEVLVGAIIGSIEYCSGQATMP